MADPPEFRIYPVSGLTDRDIGAAWPNRDSEGYGITLRYLPAAGQFAMRHTHLDNDDPERWVFDEDERSFAFYLYETVKAPDGRGETKWNRVGRAYRHQDGHGFTVLLDLLPDIRDPLCGLALRTPKETRRAQDPPARSDTRATRHPKAGSRSAGRR